MHRFRKIALRRPPVPATPNIALTPDSQAAMDQVWQITAAGYDNLPSTWGLDQFPAFLGTSYWVRLTNTNPNAPEDWKEKTLIFTHDPLGVYSATQLKYRDFRVGQIVQLVPQLTDPTVTPVEFQTLYPR